MTCLPFDVEELDIKGDVNFTLEEEYKSLRNKIFKKFI